LLVLNPDVTVGDRFVEEVLALTAKLPAIEPPVGVVGLRLLDGDGRWQRSTGQFPTLSGTLARMLLPRARRKYDSPPNDRPSPVAWVTGCCMLLRRECIEQIQGFDEDFFLYYEDVDFCRRAQRAGWAVWYAPSPTAVHHHPLHGRAVPPALRVFTRHGLLSYCSKHWPKWQLKLLARVVAAEAALREWWANGRGLHAEGTRFRELRGMARGIVVGDSRSVRRRLQRIVRHSDMNPPGGNLRPSETAGRSFQSDPPDLGHVCGEIESRDKLTRGLTQR
jgi:GT2 family glycosyltransferase